MKYFVWLLRAAFFLLLFVFALNNQHDVTVNWFFGLHWHGPMVLAMLVAFALGLVVGLVTVIPRWRRLRQREQRVFPGDGQIPEGAGNEHQDT